jgi:3-hydroxyisobutyrate dehydrogenase-like beta-hydroxyacid dehydrogenase
VVFTSLPVPADVEAVALGPNGLIEGMKPDTAFFDMSTNSVSVVRKINAAFAEKNIYMLDSPVSGGPGGAASGKMAIWVGGDEQQFNRLAGVLGAMGDQAAYIGPIGAGTIAKLVHNCTSAVMNVALAEVFTMSCGKPCARARPAGRAPSTASASSSPANTTRPISRCGCCTRMCRWRSGSARKSACRCGSPTSRSKS